MDNSANVNVKIHHQARVGSRYRVIRDGMIIFLMLMIGCSRLVWLCCKKYQVLLLIIVMISEEGNVEASIRVALLLILDCSSCQSHQRLQRTLPCQHTVCNKCIERSRRTGVLTCAECGTLHKIPKEWTRLFPINVQLHQVAQCTDMYRPRVVSPREDKSAVLSGGDSDDVARPSLEDTATLLEQVKILETSTEIYADIFGRIKDDINRLVKSGETVTLIIQERIQELHRLLDSREAILFEEIKTATDHEIGILETKLLEYKKEDVSIKTFCIDARNVLSVEHTSTLDEFIRISSTCMEIFRKAKSSRSRVPKEIVFVDRSAPKKRLKANINTYGKLIIESATASEETTTTEDDKPVYKQPNDPIQLSMIVIETKQEILPKQEDKIQIGPSYRYGHVHKHPNPIVNVIHDRGKGNFHFRHHSNDSGIGEVTNAGSPESRKESYLNVLSHKTPSGARKKSKPVSKTIHRIPIDYSQSFIQLRVGGFGKDRDNFNVPKGVAAVKDGIFAIADCGNNAVKLFDSSNEQVLECINCEDMNIVSPSVVDVCTFGSTSLLVSISREGKLLHYTTRGKHVDIFNVPTAGSSSDIWGITSDFHENIYICDRANGCVLQFDKGMKKIGEFRSFNSEKRSCPFYVTVGPDNRIYTTDSMSNTVVIFTPDGRKDTEISGENPAKGFPRFEALAGLAFDSTGNLLIVDRGQSKVIVMEPRMGYQHIFGSNESIIGDKPEGIAVLANGKVVITETSNHQALIY